jgi:putative sterol carrier protein
MRTELINRLADLDRRPVPHRAILRALPSAIGRRFDPDAAGELDAVFELTVRGREPAQFSLRISDGACEVTPGPAPNADAIATIGADDLIRLASGAIGFPELLASGGLELGGNPFLALRFPGLFRLPATAARR